MADSRFLHVCAAINRGLVRVYHRMPAEGYQRLWEAIARRRKLVAGVLGLLILASIIGIGRLSYNDNIDVMLPADAVVQRTMRFLRSANLSHDVIISLRLNNSRHSSQELLDVTERLLRSFDSPLTSQPLGNLTRRQASKD